MPKKPTSNKKVPVKKKVVKKKSQRMTKTQKKAIDKGLREIYSDGGKMPDLKKLDSRRGSALKRFLIGTLVLLIIIAAVAWAGFLVFKPYSLEQGEMISYTIEGPETVTSGEEVEYKVILKNTSDVPLANTEVRMNIPESLQIDKIKPDPTEEPKIWTIGSLRPNEEFEIVIEGYFIDQIAATRNMQAIFTYKPANFAADFQDIKTKSILIEDSVIEVEITGPESALPGEEVIYQIDYENKGELPLANVEIRAVLPSSFIVSETEPILENELQPTWSFLELPTDQKSTITIKGTFASDISGEQEIKAQAGALNSEGEFLLQYETTIESDILASDFALHLIVNGSDKDQAVDLGQNLHISIDYANSGDSEMADIELKLNIVTEPGDNDDLVDWNSLTDSRNGKVSDNTVTWTSNEIDKLELLTKDDSGIIDITIPIVDSIGPEDGGNRILILAEASIGSIGEVESEIKVQSTPIAISINSNLGLSTGAYYYSEDGEAGNGPWPPEVGTETSYRVVWTVTNALHELENVEVTTTLPEGVEWSSKTNVDAGSITYDEKSGEVVWRINKLPTSISSLQASFEVENTPTDDDVGKFIALTETSTATATDSVTDTDLEADNDPVTSELVDDEYADGTGIVADPEEVVAE